MVHNGAIIREVRLSRGMTQKDFAAALNVPQSFLSAIERGKKPAPEMMIFRLQRDFSASKQLLNAQPSPYEVGDLNFRTYKTPVAVQEAIRVTFTWIERNLRTMLGSSPFTDLSLDGFGDRASTLPPEVIEEAATATRRALGISTTGPVKNVTRALERAGIPVANLENPYIDVNKVDGVSSPTFGERPVIATTVKSAGDRVRFTRAHELGHVVLHQKLRPEQESVREAEANHFASAFLFPAEDAHREFTPWLTPAGYAQVKARFGVSIAAEVRRARDLKIIDDKRYRSLMIQISSRGWRTNEPVRVPVESIKLFSTLQLSVLQKSEEPVAEPASNAQVIDLFQTRQTP